MAKIYTTVNFEFATEIAPSDIVLALAIDEVSAEEMFYGEIPFKEEEVKQVAAFKGIAMEKIMCRNANK